VTTRAERDELRRLLPVTTTKDGFTVTAESTDWKRKALAALPALLDELDECKAVIYWLMNAKTLDGCEEWLDRAAKLLEGEG